MFLCLRAGLRRIPPAAALEWAATSSSISVHQNEDSAVLSSEISR